MVRRSFPALCRRARTIDCRFPNIDTVVADGRVPNTALWRPPSSASANQFVVVGGVKHICVTWNKTTAGAAAAASTAAAASGQPIIGLASSIKRKIGKSRLLVAVPPLLLSASCCFYNTSLTLLPRYRIVVGSVRSLIRTLVRSSLWIIRGRPRPSGKRRRRQ
jgi:hypothetical protein